MAKFEGNLKDFNDFIGPITRNVVSNLSRKHKLNTTCRHDGCNKRKPLEAAHIKGKERQVIIGEILESFQVDEDWFLVDLHKFKTEFIIAHTPIEDIILPMCKQHHLEYDRVNQMNSEYPIILDEFETADGNDVYTEKELDSLENSDYELLNKTVQNLDQSTIKEEVSKKLGVSKSQITFSRVSESNGLWNFDVKKEKFKKDIAFIFYNQQTKNFKVGLVKANSINFDDFLDKNGDVVRFLVDKNLKDRSDFDFNLCLV